MLQNKTLLYILPAFSDCLYFTNLMLDRGEPSSVLHLDNQKLSSTPAVIQYRTKISTARLEAPRKTPVSPSLDELCGDLAVRGHFILQSEAQGLGTALPNPIWSCWGTASVCSHLVIATFQPFHMPYLDEQARARTRGKEEEIAVIKSPGYTNTLMHSYCCLQGLVLFSSLRSPP